MVCDLNYHQIKPPKILKDSKKQDKRAAKFNNSAVNY